MQVVLFDAFALAECCPQLLGTALRWLITETVLVGYGIDNDLDQILFSFGELLRRDAEHRLLTWQAVDMKVLYQAEQLGLAGLCSAQLGITLDKTLQCSQWEHRPLTVDQREYAAQDASGAALAIRTCLSARAIS